MINKKITFKIYTFGCKVNQYTSSLLRENLEEIGLKYSDEKPDYIIVNMCSLTNNAVRKSRLLINRIKREEPNSEIILSGCFEEDIDIDCYRKIHTREREKIYEIFKKDHKNIEYLSEFHDHSRAFVMIQEGCKNFCSYCIVPLMRNKMYSKPINLFKKEIEFIAGNGYKEIVLTGTHINKYSYKGKGLSDIIKIIEKNPDIQRFRISSIEPDDINDEFINAISNSKKFAPHLHLSLQSADNRILGLMKRNYKVEKIKELISTLKDKIERFEFSVDIIAGFPGETKEEFNQSVKFIKENKPILVHAFPFSKRKRTKAYDMKEYLTNKEKKERASQLRDVQAHVLKKYLQKYINSTLSVLVEKYEYEFYTGYSENYIKVYIKNSNQRPIEGSIQKVKIEEVYKDGLKGSFK